MDRKSKKTLIVSIIALALVLVGVTYAYFSARITGLESASTIQLTAGRMGIVYSEGTDEFVLNNIYPRSEEWATKHFTLTGYNTTNQNMSYRVGLQIITNGFPAGYLTYDLINTTATSGTPISNKTNSIINTTGTTWFGKGTFVTGNGETHAYTLKIYFKDNGKDQNDAQGAIFSARISIEEVLENNCTFHLRPKAYSYDINYNNCLDYASDYWGLTSTEAQRYCSGYNVNGNTLYSDIAHYNTLEDLLSLDVIDNFQVNFSSYDINYDNCLVSMAGFYNGSELQTFCSGGEVAGSSISTDISSGYAESLISDGIIDNIIYITDADLFSDLVGGEQYINGQYTYAYRNTKVEGLLVDYWPYDEDGWSVTLTDVDSTDPVTSKICTSVDGIPVITAASMLDSSQASSIDLSHFNTSNIVDMSYMFASTAVTSIDLSSFDTSKVTNMQSMFWHAELTSLDLSSFDTSNVTNMSGMFSNSKVTNLDLSNFDTSSVTNMTGMFYDSAASSIDLSSFNTSNVTDMGRMFYNREASSININSFDTSNVAQMSEMFYGSAVTSLDLSSFDTSSVINIGGMFRQASNLQTIYGSNKFNALSVSGAYDMFTGCTSLIGGNGTHYDSNHTDKTYARIDLPGAPGYFTAK